MRRIAIALLLAAAATSVFASDEKGGPVLKIQRAAGRITIDGKLDDEGWKNAVPIEQFWETNPSDNVLLPPSLKTTAYLAYDEHFIYAAVDMTDPDPSAIPIRYGDHDSISGNNDDYAGVIIDSRNDSKTATLFLVTAGGTQYDAVSDDSSGNEDSSPDFYWDSATRRTEHGWIVELRIPFSSLRYRKADPQEWGIVFYRNRPRDRRYQYFSHPLPRGRNCFICSFNKLTGLEGLPSGGHIVAAPYITASDRGTSRGDLGSPLSYPPATSDAGLDVKWIPNADTSVDATVNPDFSQIESDTAAISANERFAIFYPEKRPFFLEGVELFTTPIQAVYTRTITSPRWGLRGTGKVGSNAYTLLIAQDRGGGLTILPSALGSDFANQDFASTTAIGRVRHDFGTSFVSVLGTSRTIEGGGENRVIGPDFQWRINEHSTVTGQFLYSDTRTPNRPDLANEWNGQKLSDHAADLQYSYNSAHWDFFTDAKDIGSAFRADNGFVPQVGYKSDYSELGRTFRPKGFFSRIRTYVFGEYDAEQDGTTLYRLGSIGFGADGKFRSFTRLRYAYDNVRSGDQMFTRHQLYYTLQFNVNKVIQQIVLDGRTGQDVDFANSRLGRGTTVALNANLQPTPHLELQISNSVRWLNVRADERDDRLFTAQVERVRAVYAFNNRMFVRAIVQNQRTNFDTRLYDGTVDQHSGALATQFLFAYKINWQSVLFVGVGDLREAAGDESDLRKSSREVFLKLSYAFQR